MMLTVTRSCARDPPAIVDTSATPLERMTKAELQQAADDEGLTVPADASNAAIIDAIKEARAQAAVRAQAPA